MEDVRRSPPREGPALLQGLAICGRCGQRITVRYHTRRGVRLPSYTCVRGKVQRGEPTCHTIAGKEIDAAISKVVTDVMTPEAIKVSLEVQQELQARIDEADRLRLKAVKRAQYESELARRRFLRVDPDNRLVADALEAEWNNKLRVLQQIREEYERQREADRLVVDCDVRKRVQALATNFPCLWSDPATPDRERKRMIALIIEDVTLLKGDEVVTVNVRFKGGRTETLEVPIPKNGWQAVQTAPEVIAEIDRLLDDHPYEEIADRLNERGFRPGGAECRGIERFTDRIVSRLSRDYGLCSRYDRLRARGLLTKDEIMERLGISKSTLRYWAKYGLVVAHVCDGRSYLYEDSGPDPPKKAPGRYNKLVDRSRDRQRLRKQIQLYPN